MAKLDNRIVIRIDREQKEKLTKILESINVTPSEFLRGYIKIAINSIEGNLEEDFLILSKKYNFNDDYKELIPAMIDIIALAWTSSIEFKKARKIVENAVKKMLDDYEEKVHDLLLGLTKSV